MKRSLLILPALVAALLLTWQAEATPSANPEIINPHALQFSYDVYAGGLHALQADLALDIGKTNYEVAVAAQTNGFIGSLFPWRGKYLTKGFTAEGDLSPALHEVTSVWDKKIKSTRMEFDADGTLKNYTVVKGGKEYERKFREQLAKDAVDMLTGAVKMLNNATADGSPCNITVPVFDGKRRFNIKFREAGRDYIEKNKYSSFEGIAWRCEIEVQPAGGFDKKDKNRGWMLVQEHSKKHNKQPTLWIAKVSEDAPAIPVKMMIGSQYGSAVAHLTRSNIPKNLRVGMLEQ